MRKNRLIALTAVLFTSITLFAQRPIKINLSIDGKECPSIEYSIVFITPDSSVEIKSVDGYFVPDTSLVKRGDIAIKFGKQELVFKNLTLGVHKGGSEWSVSVDYPPLIPEESYSKDPKVKWAYSIVPGNNALITEYRYIKPKKIRCRKLQ